jgi:hypothetical protein
MGSMDAHGSNAHHPDRRWLRFSLRSLMACVLVVAVGVYLASAMIVVRKREQIQRVYPIRAVYTNPEHQEPPLVWRVLGAKAVSNISLGPEGTADDVAKLKRLFPEAHVAVLDDEWQRRRGHSSKTSAR